MSLNWKMELFSSAPMFAAMSQEQLEMIASESTIAEYKQDSSIFKEGDKADSAYVISAGQISLIRKMRGEMSEIEVLGVGSIFGEKALIIESSRSVNAVAKTFCALVEINRDDFRKVLEKYPELAIFVRNHMLTKLIHIKQDLIQNISKFEKVQSSN